MIPRELTDSFRRTWRNVTAAVERFEWHWPSGWSLHRFRRLDLLADDAARAGRRLGRDASKGMKDLRRVGDDMRDSLRDASLWQRGLRWWQGLHTRERRRIIIFTLGGIALLAVSIKWSSSVKPKEPYDREPWIVPADKSQAKPKKTRSETILYPDGLGPSPIRQEAVPEGPQKARQPE